MHKNQEFLQVSMKEFIEMEHTSVESGSSKGRGDDTVPPQMMNGYMEKVVKREYELRAFTDRSLSYSWVILPIVFYLTSVIGGLMTSISIGNVYAAFDNYCILNGNFTLKDMSSIKSKTIEQSISKKLLGVASLIVNLPSMLQLLVFYILGCGLLWFCSVEEEGHQEEGT